LRSAIPSSSAAAPPSSLISSAAAASLTSPHLPAPELAGGRADTQIADEVELELYPKFPTVGRRGRECLKSSDPEAVGVSVWAEGVGFNRNFPKVAGLVAIF
jgi:hypothetical protein